MIKISTADDSAKPVVKIHCGDRQYTGRIRILQIVAHMNLVLEQSKASISEPEENIGVSMSE